MTEHFRNLANRGIARLENELLVRDFLEVMSHREAAFLEPFFHPDVRFDGGTGSRAVGRANVLRICELIAKSFTVFDVGIISMSSVGNTVHVEQTIALSLDDDCRSHRLMGFAAFEILDYRITSWHQLHG